MRMANIAIILTTHHKPEQINMYLKRIIWWLDHSTLDLFVVDSNNSDFNYLPKLYKNNIKLHLFSFNQSPDIISAQKKYPKGFRVITYCEILSIKKILEHYKHLLSSYDWIFKLTGKYVIPTLEHALVNIPNNADIIVQNKCNTVSQNSELFGFRFNNIINIFNNFNEVDVFEISLKKLLEKDTYTLYRLPILKLNPAFYQRRTNGTILGEL